MNKKGFTIIELIVVIGLLSIVMGVGVTSLFSTLRGSTRTSLTNELNSTGSYAISVMERMIKTAQSIDDNAGELCDGRNLTSLTITNYNSGKTTFACPPSSDDAVKIASVSSAFGKRTVTYLTTDTYKITKCSFSCSRPSGGSKVVTINFTVSNSVPTGATLRPEEYLNQSYRSSVVVRNTAED